MNTFLSDMEGIIQKQGERGLIYLEQYMGLQLELLREDNTGDKYSDAYGNSAGGTVKKVKEFVGVLQGDDFIQKNDHFSGNFEEGFLYTKDTDVRTNDVIKVKSNDMVRKFKVDGKESLGFTTNVFTMWKLTNLGD